MDPLSNAEQSDCFSKHDLSFSAIEHLIILPNYKEDMETLYETLDVLASHSMALTQYKICLAMEQSEMGSEEKAKTLMTKYSSQFLDITFTMHPTGISGEIRGKSSNVAWAARHMAGSAVVENDDKLAKMRHQHQILTIMDADTCFAQDYFTQITYLYCMASTAQRKLMMFAPSTVFDR